jgi:hypothetical protein
MLQGVGTSSKGTEETVEASGWMAPGYVFSHKLKVSVARVNRGFGETIHSIFQLKPKTNLAETTLFFFPLAVSNLR